MLSAGSVCLSVVSFIFHRTWMVRQLWAWHRCSDRETVGGSSLAQEEDTLCCLTSKSHLIYTRLCPSLIFSHPLHQEAVGHDGVASLISVARHTSDLAASERRPPLGLPHCGSQCGSPPGEAHAIYLLVACYISLAAGLKPCSQQQAIIVLMFSAKLAPLQLWLNGVQPVPLLSPSDTSVQVLGLLLLLAAVIANIMLVFFFLPLPRDIERNIAFVYLSQKTRLRQILPQFYSESSCDCRRIWVAIRIFALCFHL